LYAAHVNPQLQPVDTVIEARWIVPVAPARSALDGHAVVIADGRITDVLPAADVRTRYKPARHFTLGDHVLIPGLINLHTHAATTLMRGMVDDVAVSDWAHGHMATAETRQASDEFVYDGTRLACAEMLLGGVTCFNDMYFSPGAAARAALECNMRAALGMIVLESPSPYAADARDYLDKGIALRDELKDEALLTFCFAPHAPHTLTDKSLARMATFAGELDAPLHTHLHETRDEIATSLREHGARPLQRLAALGLLGPGLIAAHAVHLEPAEVELLAQYGCHIAHCPTANLKLGNGIAAVARLLSSGVNVGLGTGSAACNNRLDVFAEMRLAALLAKGESGDPAALPAWQALELATRRAACALGLDSRVGTLEIGKRADIAAVRLSGLEVTPCYDPVAHIVYAAGREHVTHVWVDGEAAVEEGRLTRIDGHDLQAKASFWRNRLRAL
jgi:5-methylthioadenosine/S-adenosylhomocysteine deaminase